MCVVNRRPTTKVGTERMERENVFLNYEVIRLDFLLSMVNGCN